MGFHRRFMRMAWSAGAASLVACADGSPGSNRWDPAHAPVVFVHGAGLSSASWSAMKEHLEELGYHPDVLVSVDIPRTGVTNETTAREIVLPAVEEALARASVLSAEAGRGAPSKVDLVTHSMGAVSGRYAAVLAPSRVRAWIALAGANHGTQALCGSPAPADREMCPAFAATPDLSVVQTFLNGRVDSPRDESPYGIGADDGIRVQPTATECIAYFTIRIEPDEWIDPPASALLSGAGGISVALDGLPVVESSEGNYLFTGATNHDDLPREARSIELVARVLGAADADWPRRCQSVTSTDHAVSAQ